MAKEKEANAALEVLQAAGAEEIAAAKEDAAQQGAKAAALQERLDQQTKARSPPAWHGRPDNVCVHPRHVHGGSQARATASCSAQVQAALQAKVADLKAALAAAVRDCDALADQKAKSGAAAEAAAAAAEAEAASLCAAMARLEARLEQQASQHACTITELEGGNAALAARLQEVRILAPALSSLS